MAVSKRVGSITHWLLVLKARLRQALRRGWEDNMTIAGLRLTNNRCETRMEMSEVAVGRDPGVSPPVKGRDDQ